MQRREAPTGALAPLIKRLSGTDDENESGWISADLDNGLRLIASIDPIDHDEWRQIAAALNSPPPAVISRSSAAGYRAILAAVDGSAGVDVETLHRLELNATSADAWLTVDERAVVNETADPVLELACRWVLKEAYGKALGLGLALPLDALAFIGRNGEIVLDGAVAPATGNGWRFALYSRACTLLGVAYRRGCQTGMPLAPIGRKPPAPLLDR